VHGTAPLSLAARVDRLVAELQKLRAERDEARQRVTGVVEPWRVRISLQSLQSLQRK